MLEYLLDDLNFASFVLNVVLFAYGHLYFLKIVWSFKKGGISSLKCLSKDIQKCPDDHPSCLDLGGNSAGKMTLT